MFSTAMCEKIGFYVYCLVDPRNENIFYVGKGVGNRVFQHAEGVIKATAKDSDKIQLIKDIIQQGLKPRYYILRHQLTDTEALEYEALAIDLLSLVKNQQQPLTNIQGGKHSSKKGLMPLEEILRKYDPQQLETKLPIVLITIDKEYDKLKSLHKQGLYLSDEARAEQIYERTRKSWVIGDDRYKAKYAVAVYRGWTVAAYEIKKWYPSEEYEGRWAFNGIEVSKNSPIYDELVNKLTYQPRTDQGVLNDGYKAPQNPITYRNVKNQKKS